MEFGLYTVMELFFINARRLPLLAMVTKFQIENRYRNILRCKVEVQVIHNKASKNLKTILIIPGLGRQIWGMA